MSNENEEQVHEWVRNETNDPNRKMKDLQNANWFLLKERSRGRHGGRNIMKLTESRAHVLPIVNGNQMPSPIEVSSTKIIRAACQSVSPVLTIVACTNKSSHFEKRL